MTIQEIRAKIVEWITTGIPSNVKSFRIRTLLTNMAIRMDLLEAGRLKITKAEGNFALELEVGDNIYGYIESQLVYDAIYLGGDISLLSSYLVLNGPGSGGASSGYFEYDDIADMIANQLEQTTGDRCYVADASDDPNVTSGDAIYIYLGTTLEDLIDYRRLTDGEISLVTDNINRTFRVTDLSTSASTTVDSGLVKVQYENVDNSVIAILFPIDFSKYLLGMQSNDSEYDFAISIFNRTQNCWVGEASVGFVTVNTNYVKVTTSQKLIPYPNLAAGDIIEVYFDSYKTSAGINTLTGDGVDNTDPDNPVMDLSNWQQTSEKGVANGYASLDSGGKVPSGQLPSYVDDVLEFDDLASFPATGETGKIYVAKDTNKTYRWSGSVYVEISSPDIPTEEQIKGTRISESVATTKNIDLDTVSDFHYTMTADTAFTFTNTPTGTQVRRCKLRLTGEFAPSWTQAGLQVFGDGYDGTKWNDILVEMWLDGTIKGLLIFQQRETA